MLEVSIIGLHLISSTNGVCPKMFLNRKLSCIRVAYLFQISQIASIRLSLTKYLAQVQGLLFIFCVEVGLRVFCSHDLLRLCEVKFYTQEVGVQLVLKVIFAHLGVIFGNTYILLLTLGNSDQDRHYHQMCYQVMVLSTILL